MIHRHRVLFAGDDAAQMTSVSTLVERLGHATHVTGFEGGAARLDAFRPHLVITDALRGRPWLEGVLADGRPRPLLVAGIGVHATTGRMSPFDYLIAGPLHAYALLRLLWRVEVRRSRSRRGTGTRERA